MQIIMVGTSRHDTRGSGPTNVIRQGRVVVPTAAAAILAVLCGLATPAVAQIVADFYKGRQIKFVVGTASGQDYDLWARLIGRHITRHIPGQPTLIVENMPAARHIIAP